MTQIIVLPHVELCPDGAVIDAAPGTSVCDVLLGNEIDIVVYAEFPDIDALHAYKKHPTYMDVTNTVRPRRELRFAADVEV